MVQSTAGTAARTIVCGRQREIKRGWVGLFLVTCPPQGRRGKDTSSSSKTGLPEATSGAALKQVPPADRLSAVGQFCPTGFRLVVSLNNRGPCWVESAHAIATPRPQWRIRTSSGPAEPRLPATKLLRCSAGNCSVQPEERASTADRNQLLTLQERVPPRTWTSSGC